MSLSNRLSIKDLDLTGQRVLMRVDYNVPVDKKTGAITDKRRIEMTLPTIKYALDEKKAKAVILMAHFGRPDGQVVPKMSLKPVAEALEQLIQRPVTFLSDCVGAEVEAACANPAEGSIILLENVRFHKEDEGKGKDAEGNVVKATEAEIAAFREALTKNGDVFVNDAFGAAHRAHSSVVGVNLEKKAAGLLMAKELEAFAQVLENPARPFVGILGGAKISDKIQLVESLLDKVDELIIGGGMAYTFLNVTKGMTIGTSLFDKAGADIVPRIMQKAEDKNVKLHFPVDFRVTAEFGKGDGLDIRTSDEGIPEHMMGLDCGPKSIEAFTEVVNRAKLICWNGPLGVFEVPAFSVGSVSVLEAVCNRTGECCTIIGGGDTASLAENKGLVPRLSHVSTGGGASLELLEGKLLPGVDCLTKKN